MSELRLACRAGASVYPTCEHLLETGSVEERRLVTAVFVDLVGSTSLGERLDPEVLRLVLTRYFEEMSAAIEKWGGSVAKYVGDAVVGVFGLPARRETMLTGPYSRSSKQMHAYRVSTTRSRAITESDFKSARA